MRREVDWHISLLDAHVRAVEISVNGVERVIMDLDLHDAAGMEEFLGHGADVVDPRMRMLLTAAMAHPEVSLRLGMDLTIKGWWSFPDDPPSAFFEMTPDPGGGIGVITPKPAREVVAIR